MNWRSILFRLDNVLPIPQDSGPLLCSLPRTSIQIRTPKSHEPFVCESATVIAKLQPVQILCALLYSTRHCFAIPKNPDYDGLQAEKWRESYGWHRWSRDKEEENPIGMSSIFAKLFRWQVQSRFWNGKGNVLELQHGKRTSRRDAIANLQLQIIILPQQQG